MTIKCRTKMAIVPVLILCLMVILVSSAWAEYVNKAVTNRDDAVYWLDLGGLYATYGNYSAAVEAYQKALTLDANNSKAYYDMSVARAELGQMDQALAEINRAIALAPDRDRYYYGRAWLLLRMGRSPEAMDNFRKAAEMGNLDAKAYLNLKR